MTTLVTTMERDLNDKLPSFAWPGGYTLVYYSLDGTETLCPSCATSELDSWIDADWRGPSVPESSDKNWYDGPHFVDVLYEGREICASCDTEIKGSYED